MQLKILKSFDQESRLDVQTSKVLTVSQQPITSTQNVLMHLIQFIYYKSLMELWRRNDRIK
jgi:hypothetical protein